MKPDQELINRFAKVMQSEGHQVMKCPECSGAIWIEGDVDGNDSLIASTLKLMRYSTEEQCQKCSELHDKVCVQE